MSDHRGGPLGGARIVDFTANMSGPMGTMILADQGADVIKVEPPGGDMLRRVGPSRSGISGYFANLNRNKRSVAIDLTLAAGRQLADRLIDTADVVVQNFRPAAAARLGLTGPELRRARPRLIYAQITGYGTTGPYSGRPVYDHVVQAAAGIAASQTDKATGQPALVRQGIVDKVAARDLAQGITAALFQRSRTGVGCELDVCMLNSAIAFLWPDGMMSHTILEPDTVTPSIANTFRLTPTADGHVAMTVLTDAQWRGALAAVGYAPPEMAGEAWTAQDRLRHGGPVMKEIALRLGELSTEEVVATMAVHDVPCAPVVSLDDLPQHPQVLANEAITEVDHPLLGRVRQARPAVAFSVDDQPTAGTPAPALGEHTVDVLSEIGVAGADIERLHVTGVVSSSPDRDRGLRPAASR